MYNHKMATSCSSAAVCQGDDCRDSTAAAVACKAAASCLGHTNDVGWDRASMLEGVTSQNWSNH